MQLINLNVRMNVYHRAKRNDFGVRASDLMNYCESHRITRDSEAVGESIRYLYNMPDGNVVVISGRRSAETNEFIPGGWRIEDPRSKAGILPGVMAKIREMRSMIHR